IPQLAENFSYLHHLDTPDRVGRLTGLGRGQWQNLSIRGHPMPIVCRIVALATIASAICSSPAWAQYGVPIPRSKKSQRQPPKLKEIEGKAVIGAVGHRVLGVTLRQKTWLVRIAPGTHVEVRGY